MSRTGDRLFATLQYLLPKRFLSRIIYSVMRSEKRWLRRRLVAFFLRNYNVNMDEAVVSDPHLYPSFNAFFTRALKNGVRPLDSDPRSFVSPVDGTVSQSGIVADGRILQAKSRTFSLAELLANDGLAAKYRDGSFAIIYLAPYNYHRIHMPHSGTVRQTIYVPGDLFSVNAATARSVPRLFARNERVICDFSSSHGDFAMVYVGALFVGKMQTRWCGEVNPPPRRKRQSIGIQVGNGRALNKGDEAGRFNMGSTVILITERDRVRWSNHLIPGATLKMGERIGTLL